MERNLTLRGAVIGTSPFGELHRSIKLLSPELGVINAVIYGGRKGKKTSFAPLFSFGTFSLYFNPVNNEYSLTDEDTVFSPESLMQDLKINCAASFFCEASSKLDSQDYSRIYPLLCSSLTLLENRPDLADRIIIAFTWKLLILSGIEPDLSSCPICEKPYKDDEILYFSTSLNAPVCQKCADSDYPVLLPGCRRFLRYTSSMDLTEMIEVELYKTSEKRIRDYLLAYIDLFSGGRLKTLETGLIQ